MSNINKSGSLFKRNINTSEEFGIIKKLNVPNSVTYTETEIAEEKRRMAKRATPNCTTCPECPPYEEDDDDGGSVVVPPNTGLPGELPNNMFQSVIGYAENGYPLAYLFPENGKSAWDTLYEYLFSLNDGRTDIIFWGEKSLVHEDNPSSGDMVGGFADGFSKALLELTGRELYATPIYYGLETIRPSTYNALDSSTHSDANPNGHGRVLVGTRNVYNSIKNSDNSSPFINAYDPLDGFSPEVRVSSSFTLFYTENKDPNFYTYYLPSSTNIFKIRDGGERDDSIDVKWNQSTRQYEYDGTRVFGVQGISAADNISYHGLRTFLANGSTAGGANFQPFLISTSKVSLNSNSNFVSKDEVNTPSYFTVDSLFNRPTLSVLQPSDTRSPTIGEGTLEGQDIVVDKFYYYSLIYGLVPPYLGKWYSPDRQGEQWQTGDDFQIDQVNPTRQKIRLQKNENGQYTIIYDPNTTESIDLRNTNLNYLNTYFPFSPELKNDAVAFQLDNGRIRFTFLASYFLKLRHPNFNWANYITMPGFDETSIFPTFDSWSFVTLDTSITDADGGYAVKTQELTERYNNTKISNLDIEGSPPTLFMPDVYQLKDGLYSISWPADFPRRVGASIPNPTEEQKSSIFEEQKLGFATENTMGIKPYQIGLPLSSLFRRYKEGVFGDGPEQFLNSTSSGVIFQATNNQQEFCLKSYYYSGYLNQGEIVPKLNEKSRRVQCYMKTGLYMNSNDQYYTRADKEPLYTTNNFKYLVGYIKLPTIQSPSGELNESLRNSTICLSITPETNTGTLGTTVSNTHTQVADDIYFQHGFVDLSANLSQLSSSYTKLNLSFLGYNTNNKTEGDVVVTTHSGIDANNTNGLSFSVFAVDPALRLADIEYAYRAQGFMSLLAELLRHIKQRQTNTAYGGNNTNSRIVFVWLLGRPEAGNDFGQLSLYGGLQANTYMSVTFTYIQNALIGLGFAPSDILHLFITHPKAAKFSNIVDEFGKVKQNPLEYTNLANTDPRSTFNGTKSIFFATNENQNPSLGFLKTKRNKTISEKVNFINSYRLFDNTTQQYEKSIVTEALASRFMDVYHRNILYFDTPAMANVNINNRLNDSHYSVEYDINNNPVVSYKYLNERGYLQVGKDMINIMKNGL